MNTQATGNMIDELFDQAARNQGFESLEELVEVYGWLESKTNLSILLANMNDPTSIPMTPKPEFKAQFEAWLAKKNKK